MDLTNEFYGASTWSIGRPEFSTIYIQGWDSAGRKFREWINQFRRFFDRLAKEIPGSLEQGDQVEQGASCHQGIGAGGRCDAIRMVGELILVPQLESGILRGDTLTYKKLQSDQERSLIVKNF
jgi:hypothetical protein